MDTKDAGKLGGARTLEKYGVEHFRAMRALSTTKGRKPMSDNEILPASLKRREYRKTHKKK